MAIFVQKSTSRGAAHQRDASSMAWRLWVLQKTRWGNVARALGLLFDLRVQLLIPGLVHYTASSSGDAGRRCYAAARRGLDELRVDRAGALLLRGPSEAARRTGPPQADGRRRRGVARAAAVAW